eukprot:4285241-Prymnesium_polylepis.1
MAHTCPGRATHQQCRARPTGSQRNEPSTNRRAPPPRTEPPSGAARRRPLLLEHRLHQPRFLAHYAQRAVRTRGQNFPGRRCRVVGKPPTRCSLQRQDHRLRRRPLVGRRVRLVHELRQEGAGPHACSPACCTTRGTA